MTTAYFRFGARGGRNHDGSSTPIIVPAGQTRALPCVSAGGDRILTAVDR